MWTASCKSAARRFLLLWVCGLRIHHRHFLVSADKSEGNGHILDTVLHSSPRVPQLFLRHCRRKYKLE